MICKKCGEYFPTKYRIDGKVHDLKNRRFCLNCSPFGMHNTKKLDRTDYRCSRCGDTNPDNFSKGRYTECKKCRGEYNKKTMHNNKVNAVKYLGGKCMCCGYSSFILRR